MIEITMSFGHLHLESDFQIISCLHDAGRKKIVACMRAQVSESSQNQLRLKTIIRTHISVMDLSFDML